MPRASSWVRERRAAPKVPTQPAPVAVQVTPPVVTGSARLSLRAHLYASVGDEGLVGRYGTRVAGELLQGVQEREDAGTQRGEDTEALERAYYLAWARAEVSCRAVEAPANDDGPMSQTVAYLLGELDRLNGRWRRGLELDRQGWGTAEAEERAFQTFRAIAAEAEEVWSLLEALAPNQLKGRYFLEPVEDATETSAA